MKRLDSRRSAALLSGGGVSRSSGRSASHSLYKITVIQERCFPLTQIIKSPGPQADHSITLVWNSNISGTLSSSLATESPGPQACQPHTLCTEELRERCLPLWRWNLLVLRLVSLILSVRKNYRSAAFLSGDEISRSLVRSVSHSLYGRTAGALPSCLAMESPGPQACQPHTFCTEELQERCLPVWRWNLQVLRNVRLTHFSLCTEELQERCLPVWRWNLQVRRHVNLKISVRKNYIFKGVLHCYSAMKSPKSSSS